MTINFWGISLLGLGFLEIILLICLYLKYKHTPSIICYILIVISVFVWVLSNSLLALGIDEILGNFLHKMTYIGGTFIATTFWLFSFVFPWPKVKLYPKYIIIAILIPTLISILLLSTDLIVLEYQGYYAQQKYVSGPLYWVFVLYFLSFWAWGVLNIIRTYKQADRFYKRVVRLLLTGILGCSIVGITTDIFLPWFIGYPSPFNAWVGSSSTLIWLVYMTRVLMIKE